MATMSRRTSRRCRHAASVAKPSGSIHPRVQKFAPEHFGIVPVDCAKARSKWMLTDFYGKILIPPQVTISRLVQRLKGKTAYRMLQEFAPLRKQFWGRHLWARGYFCCSSGNVTDQVVAEYIANQGQPGPGDFRVEGDELQPTCGGGDFSRALLGTGLES